MGRPKETRGEIAITGVQSELELWKRAVPATAIGQFSTRGSFSHGYWQRQETFLVEIETSGRWNCYWHLERTGQGCCQHLMMHRTVPTTKKYLSPNVNSAKVKKPCDGGTQALKEQWLGRE